MEIKTGQSLVVEMAVLWVASMVFLMVMTKAAW